METSLKSRTQAPSHVHQPPATDISLQSRTRASSYIYNLTNIIQNKMTPYSCSVQYGIPQSVCLRGLRYTVSSASQYTVAAIAAAEYGPEGRVSALSTGRSQGSRQPPPPPGLMHTSVWCATRTTGTSTTARLPRRPHDPSSQDGLVGLQCTYRETLYKGALWSPPGGCRATGPCGLPWGMEGPLGPVVSPEGRGH